MYIFLSLSLSLLIKFFPDAFCVKKKITNLGISLHFSANCLLYTLCFVNRDVYLTQSRPVTTMWQENSSHAVRASDPLLNVNTPVKQVTMSPMRRTNTMVSQVTKGHEGHKGLCLMLQIKGTKITLFSIFATRTSIDFERLP